jgi:ubiquinone/menaquinone biosynthesis C-methylase UbiE
LSEQLIRNGESRHSWERMTEGWRSWYDKFSKQSAAATCAILELAQIREGMRVLDIACGSGEPSLSLARAVGPTGHVIATDIVAGMLEIAEENARSRGLSNIEFRIADAESIPFPDKSFDAVTCRFGVMFFSDPERAMREARRVLRNNGVIALVTWGPSEDNPRFATTTCIVEKYREKFNTGVDFPKGDNNLFRFAKRGSLSRILGEAGFREISEKYLKIPWTWEGSAEEQFKSFSQTSAPFSKMFEGLNQDAQRSVTNEILSAMEKYYDGRQVNFTAVINTAVGKKIEGKKMGLIAVP